MTFREAYESRINAHLDVRIREAFRQAALQVYARVEADDFLYESQTNNLRASTGVGIFKDGVLTDWVQNPIIPTSEKKFTYHGATEMVDGNELLQQALTKIQTDGIGKWVFLVVATVPYAAWVDEGNGGTKRGSGWWTDDFAPNILDEVIYQLETLIR